MHHLVLKMFQQHLRGKDKMVKITRRYQKQVKGHYKTVKGKRVHVRGHLRLIRTDIKKKGKGR